MTTSTSTGKAYPWAGGGGVLLFLAAWQGTAWLIDNSLLLPGPLQVLVTLGELAGQGEFWLAVRGTFLRGLGAFLLAAAAGTAAGLAAGRSPLAGRLLAPWMAVVKSTPVLSIILLAIIWFKTPQVPLFVAFLVGFPIVAGNVREGVSQADGDLKEMLCLYGVSRGRRFLHLYLPAAMPYLLAGFSTALGITWKAVVAAEVLAMPARALGTGMNLARSQLETAEVFAWTAAAVLLSAVTEILLQILRRRTDYREGRP